MLDFFFRVNTITLLIAIISLSEGSNSLVESRLEAIFDLMDFDNSSQLTFDEFVRFKFVIITFIIA